MNINKLTQKEVSELLMVDIRTVRRYGNEDIPIPIHGVGKGIWYVWAEVMGWRDRRMQKAVGTIAAAMTEDVVDGKREKALLTRAQREQAEIVTATKRKEVVTIEDFEQTVAAILVPVRTNLLAVSSRLRPAIGPEASGKVDEEIRRSLRDLVKRMKGTE